MAGYAEIEGLFPLVSIACRIYCPAALSSDATFKSGRGRFPPLSWTLNQPISFSFAQIVPLPPSWPAHVSTCRLRLRPSVWPHNPIGTRYTKRTHQVIENTWGPVSRKPFSAPRRRYEYRRLCQCPAATWGTVSRYRKRGEKSCSALLTRCAAGRRRFGGISKEG